MLWARPICLRLETQEMAWAFARALARAGSNMAARIAMMAMTTSSSINVKANTFLIFSMVVPFFVFDIDIYQCENKCLQ